MRVDDVVASGGRFYADQLASVQAYVVTLPRGVPFHLE
jgi:hypothetical protein